MNIAAIPLAETPSVDRRLLQAGALTLCLVLLSATGLLLADSARAQERSVEWTHLSSESGDLPAPNGGDQQTATAVLDVDVDGTNDFMIAERTGTPSVVWYRRSQEGWEKYAVENKQLPIEAGSATHDIDGDGDQDVVFGGDAQNNKVWWWENPAPDFAPDQSWTRHLITETPGNKHHDQIFGDVDGDGQAELLFWNQGAQRLYLAEIPDDPQAAGRWETEVIYTYSADSQMEQRGSYPGWRDTNEHEGLYTADVDGDDTLDVVGGGRWVTHRGEGSSTESGIEGRFQEHIVDASYPFSRSAAGQLVEGGRPEVALVVGDGRGPLVLYEYQPDGNEDSGSVGAGTWAATTLIEEVQNGHSLDVVDFNGDGHQDLFVAEMRLGENPDAKTWLLLGDGQGNFRRQVVSEGYGLHQAKIADLDGDEDLDILGKPYTWEAPRIDIWINEGPEQSGSTQSETTGSARGPRPGEGHPSRWYGQADYRLPVQVRAAGYERRDKPVEVTLYQVLRITIQFGRLLTPNCPAQEVPPDMYNLPEVTEPVEQLKELVRKEKDAQIQRRFQMLLLLKTGEAKSRSGAARQLDVHRHTVSDWLSLYEEGGIEKIQEVEDPGPEPGQQSIPPEAMEALKDRLAESEGFGSYKDIQRWLAEEQDLELCYSTVHGIVRYELGAKLKAPRPSYPKKTNRSK